MSETTNMYIVHTYNKDQPTQNRFQGVYSNKELADTAGKDYCETWGDNLHYTVTISALDDIINGAHISELK